MSTVVDTLMAFLWGLERKETGEFDGLTALRRFFTMGQQVLSCLKGDWLFGVVIVVFPAG